MSSDEYLNYAEQNRAEWEERGQEIVSMLVDEVTAGEEPDPEPAPRPSGKRLSAGSRRTHMPNPTKEVDPASDS